MAFAEDERSAAQGGIETITPQRVTETPGSACTPQKLEERLSFICDLWQAKRGAKPLPTRAELDPAEFHRLWPVTFLLEKDQSDGEWYVRFAGAAYGSVYGR